MRIFGLFISILIGNALISCKERQVMHLYSNDRIQCITIIDDGEFRYIIDGEHTKVPPKNFVKLDVEGIDPLGDAIHVCWRSEKFEWDLVVDNSKIIHSGLDTLRFRIKTSLPKDDRGISSEKKFRANDCMVFSYYLKRLLPDKGGVVEIL